MLPSASISLVLDRLAVDDQLDRHAARVADAGPLDVPVGLLIERPAADRIVGLFGQHTRRRGP